MRYSVYCPTLRKLTYATRARIDVQLSHASGALACGPYAGEATKVAAGALPGQADNGRLKT
jgi:hypothetical protein